MTPNARNNRTRAPYKQGLLFTLAGLLILVEVLTVFAVLASQRFATERALQEYTHELLRNVVDETRENAAGYLRQAEDSVSLTAGVFEGKLLSISEPEALDRFLLEHLRIVPQIDALYFGDGDGNFVFSKRNADTKGYLSKIIRTDQPVAQRVSLVQRSTDLSATSMRHDPEDRYDPRKRPWFSRALAGNGVVWTAPYIFYTSQRPGLTTARVVHGPAGQVLGVVGADVELSALSDFLRMQRIGRSGAAFVVYSNGDVLAHPDADALARTDADGTLRLRKLDELDPVAALASARLQGQLADLSALEQAHYDRFEYDGQQFLSMFVPLLAQGENQWVMGVYAPEDELAKKIREGQRESIFLGVAVSVLVVTAAIMVGLIALRPLYTLQRHAQEDPLTGLLNRRSFDSVATRHLGAALRNGQSVSALMVDIDCFKPINDQHGHKVGDEVLQAVSRRLARCLSNADLLARYGGEEFAIILPGANLQQGVQIAERLREAVAGAPIKTSIGPLSVTVSLGVAEKDHGGDTIAEMLHRADIHLIAAKRQGRNRVVAD